MFKEFDDLIDHLQLPYTDKITRQDFADWRHHPITMEFMAYCKIYILQNAERLTNTPIDEAAKTEETLIRGEINAMRYLLEWEPADLTEEKEN